MFGKKEHVKLEEDRSKEYATTSRLKGVEIVDRRDREKVKIVNGKDASMMKRK